MNTKWFEIWFEDKKSILETMKRNMQADLDAGYNPNGYAIYKQILEITEYEHGFDVQIELFKLMDDKQVERWCYYDLKKRGAIL